VVDANKAYSVPQLSPGVSGSPIDPNDTVRSRISDMPGCRNVRPEGVDHELQKEDEGQEPRTVPTFKLSNPLNRRLHA
jgi:hypothetical protein